MRKIRYGLFSKKIRAKTYFSIIFSLLTLCLLVFSAVFYSLEVSGIYEELFIFSCINLMLAILTWIFVIYKANNGNGQPNFTKEEIIFLKTPMKQVRVKFFKLFEKYIVKKDEQYKKFARRNKILYAIRFWLFILLFLLYIPLAIYYPLIGDYFNEDPITIWVLKLGGLDLLIYCLYYLAQNKTIKNIWNSRVNLVSKYHGYLREEIGIHSIDAGNIKFPGKGIQFKNAIHLSPSIIENNTDSLSSEEEAHLLHELAKNMIYRFQNYRDILLYGIILSFQSFLLLFFIENTPTKEWVALITITLFMYILGASFSIFTRLVDYSRVPRMVIGARVATWKEERRMEQAQFAAASYIDSGDDIDMELASEELDKLKKIVEEE